MLLNPRKGDGNGSVRPFLPLVRLVSLFLLLFASTQGRDFGGLELSRIPRFPDPCKQLLARAELAGGWNTPLAPPLDPQSQRRKSFPILLGKRMWEHATPTCSQSRYRHLWSRVQSVAAIRGGEQQPFVTRLFPARTRWCVKKAAFLLGYSLFFPFPAAVLQEGGKAHR